MKVLAARGCVACLLAPALAQADGGCSNDACAENGTVDLLQVKSQLKNKMATNDEQPFSTTANIAMGASTTWANPPVCQQWCPVVTQSWAEKCGWSSCGSCTECSGELLSCFSWCYDHGHSWDQKCSWSQCTDCQECSATTPVPVASSKDDPHVQNLAGEEFDVNKPGEYVMFRLPSDLANSALIEVRALMQANVMSSCGLYMKSVTLTGNWLHGQTVHVRTHTRDVPGSNTAGNLTVKPFALQVLSRNATDVEHWRTFANLSVEAASGETLTDKVTVAALKREEYGNRLEAQAFEFRFGPSQLRKKRATLIVAQASRQALNIDLAQVGHLGELARNIGGLLGTERHDKKIEELTRDCKMAKAAKKMRHGASIAPEAMQMISGTRELQAESFLKASWA